MYKRQHQHRSLQPHHFCVPYTDPSSYSSSTLGTLYLSLIHIFPKSIPISVPAAIVKIPLSLSLIYHYYVISTLSVYVQFYTRTPVSYTHLFNMIMILHTVKCWFDMLKQCFKQCLSFIDRYTDQILKINDHFF